MCHCQEECHTVTVYCFSKSECLLFAVFWTLGQKQLHMELLIWLSSMIRPHQHIHCEWKYSYVAILIWLVVWIIINVHIVKKKHRTNTSWNETWISNCCHDDCDWMTGTNLLTKSPHGSSCDLNEQICFPSALQRWLLSLSNTRLLRASKEILWCEQIRLNFHCSVPSCWRGEKTLPTWQANPTATLW